MMSELEELSRILGEDALNELMPVRTYDNLLEADLVHALCEEIKQTGLKYGWNSNSDVEYGHWNTFFAGKSKKNRTPVDDQLTGTVRLVAEEIKRLALPHGSQIIRCYCNAYTFGTEGYPHTDSKIDSDITVVLYLNKEWRPEWAGETVFFDDEDEIINAVLPKFGRLVVFPSAMLHAARSVSRICSDLRMVFVLKVRTE